QRQTNEFNLQPGTVTITAVRNITTGVVTKIGFADSTVKALMRNMLESTKAENCYWLLDLLGFLFGQYSFSLFGKLTDQAYK
ncbi:hypothetical protein, partial [Pseudomonas aeruginosa]|uniref:hypothetical protein n=1 Tax=Pseudomonas aeruginosa TaxID=287 RepID=UPI00114F8A8F